MQNASWKKGQCHLKIYLLKSNFQTKLKVPVFFNIEGQVLTESILWHTSRMQWPSY